MLSCPRRSANSEISLLREPGNSSRTGGGRNGGTWHRDRCRTGLHSVLTGNGCLWSSRGVHFFPQGESRRRCRGGHTRLSPPDRGNPGCRCGGSSRLSSRDPDTRRSKCSALICTSSLTLAPVVTRKRTMKYQKSWCSAFRFRSSVSQFLVGDDGVLEGVAVKFLPHRAENWRGRDRVPAVLPPGKEENDLRRRSAD